MTFRQIFDRLLADPDTRGELAAARRTDSRTYAEGGATKTRQLLDRLGLDPSHHADILERAQEAARHLRPEILQPAGGERQYTERGSEHEGRRFLAGMAALFANQEARAAETRRYEEDEAAYAEFAAASGLTAEERNSVPPPSRPGPPDSAAADRARQDAERQALREEIERFDDEADWRRWQGFCAL